jgi:flagellar protein FlaF
MTNQAVQAYQQVASKTIPQRDLEASLLSAAAAHFERIRNDWASLAAELPNALKFNRKLWTIFVTSVTDNESQLPLQVRQNVANLGIFVFNETLAIQANPRPEALAPLIAINRELAAGLLGR